MVDGQPKHYAMLVPVTSEVNNLGLNPVVTTTSSSFQLVVNDLTLTADTLALHNETHPSIVKDHKRIPTPEKFKRSG